MRIITGTIVIIFLNLGYIIPAKAQLTGGGSTQENNESQSSGSLFERSGYLKVGWANPKGNFGTPAELGSNYNSIFSGEDGMGAQSGFAISFEGVSPTNTLSRIANAKTQLGIKYGVQYTNNPVDWSNLGGGWETSTEYSSFHFLDLKLGAVYAIEPVNDFIIDLFYNPMFTLVIPGEWYYDGSITDEITPYDEYGELDVPFGLRHGIGFQLRYNAFLFSVETIWGSLDYNFYHTRTGSSSDEEWTYNNSLKNNSTLITFGLAF